VGLVVRKRRSVQALASVVHSFGVLVHCAVELVRALQSWVQRRLGSLGCTALGNVLFGLATLKAERPLALVRGVAAEVAKALSAEATFHGTTIARIVYALGRLGSAPPALVGPLCKEALRRLPSFNSVDVLNTLKGLAMLVCAHAVTTAATRRQAGSGFMAHRPRAACFR
jgi:hypothetical protein